MTTNKTTLTLAMASALAIGAYGLIGSTPTYAAQDAAAAEARAAANRADAAADEANEAANYAAAQARGGGLSRMQIIERLSAQGYTNIHDLEFDEDGVWKAEANEPNTGEEVDLWIDGVDGHVLKKNDD